MSKKLDPKIIRVGDMVRIDNPEMFIRCGYPMSLEDACKEVDELFGDDILRLLDSVATDDHLKMVSFTSLKNKDSKMYQTILKELAFTTPGQTDNIGMKFTYFRGDGEFRVITRFANTTKNQVVSFTYRTE